jgi:tRNA G18 (ribose-2'-O)-methylase SpoU
MSRKNSRMDAHVRFERERRRNLLAAPGPSELILVLDHLKPGFNVAKIFRSAQAFGVREIHLIAIGAFDPAPAKGALRAVQARWLDGLGDSLSLLRKGGYRAFRMLAEGGAALQTTALPRRCALVLGHEEFGLSAETQSLPALTIAQHGAVQSLNVSVAASIAMYEYIRQHPIMR